MSEERYKLEVPDAVRRENGTSDIFLTDNECHKRDGYYRVLQGRCVRNIGDYIANPPHQPVFVRGVEFVSEISFMSSIGGHPNCIEPIWDKLHNGLAFEKLDPLPGYNCFKNGVHPALVLLDIALAIEHLHTLDIVHGDIKPWNVLMNKDKRAVLIDFGMSRREHHMYSRELCVRGTNGYVPDGEKDLDQFVDVWGFSRIAELVINKYIEDANEEGSAVYSWTVCVGEDEPRPYYEVLVEFCQADLGRRPTMRQIIDSGVLISPDENVAKIQRQRILASREATQKCIDRDIAEFERLLHGEYEASPFALHDMLGASRYSGTMDGYVVDYFRILCHIVARNMEIHEHNAFITGYALLSLVNKYFYCEQATRLHAREIVFAYGKEPLELGRLEFKVFKLLGFAIGRRVIDRSLSAGMDVLRIVERGDRLGVRGN